MVKTRLDMPIVEHPGIPPSLDWRRHVYSEKVFENTLRRNQSDHVRTRPPTPRVVSMMSPTAALILIGCGPREEILTGPRAPWASPEGPRAGRVYPVLHKFRHKKFNTN